MVLVSRTGPGIRPLSARNHKPAMISGVQYESPSALIGRVKPFMDQFAGTVLKTPEAVPCIRYPVKSTICRSLRFAFLIYLIHAVFFYATGALQTAFLPGNNT